MFLPFGLRTAPRIFNLFAEALHWVFETLHEWNVTYYLDDFLFSFPPHTDISTVSAQFNDVLAKFGLTKATEKDSDGCVVVHLGFESQILRHKVGERRLHAGTAVCNNFLAGSGTDLLELIFCSNEPTKL